MKIWHKAKFLRSLFFVSIFFCYFNACEAYEAVFHNIGQGNCTVIKSPDKRVLVVDAGSSNTTGIPGIPDKDKYRVLAQRVFESIEREVSFSKWLVFIVSHPDRDHLNLVKRMIDLARTSIPDVFVGVLLGGTYNIYSKEDSKELVDFLIENSIPHRFGDKFSSTGLFYEEDESSPKILSGWLGKIDFLSVDSRGEAAIGGPLMRRRKALKKEEGGAAGAGSSSTPLSTIERPFGDDGTNKVSIVIKIHCDTFSVMLTGDKTKTETERIIRRFQDATQIEQLKTDVLLATHHGSATDFVPEWIALTNPRHVVISAGRSFDHPRSEAFEGYFMNASHLTPAPWHFVQFQGDFIDYDDTTRTLRSIARETPSSPEKARGYVHAITDRSIFVTASNGDIAFFSTSPGAYAINIGRKWDDELTAITEFFSVLQLLSGDVISIETIRLDGMTKSDSLLSIFLDDRFNGLRSLSMKEADLMNEHVGVLSALITKHRDLSFLHLTGNKFSSEGMKTIIDVWDHRGLTL